jgi:hypothetical protein
VTDCPRQLGKWREQLVITVRLLELVALESCSLAGRSVVGKTRAPKHGSIEPGLSKEHSFAQRHVTVGLSCALYLRENLISVHKPMVRAVRLISSFQPRRLMIAPAADGRNPWSRGWHPLHRASEPSVYDGDWHR